jgi:glycosyltransferase 2 family protein
LKKKIFKGLRYILFLFIGIILLYLAFRGIDIKKVWAEIVHAKYIWIIFSVLLLTSSHLIRAYRWNLLIEALNYRPPFRNTFFSMMVGYLANYAFPRIGEITRCAVLAKTEKIPADKLFGTVIIERAVDVITLMVFLVILITARFEFFSHFIKPQIFEPFTKFLSSLFHKSLFIWILVISIPVILLFLIYKYRAHLAKWNFFIKIKNVIKGILSGLKTVYTMKKRFAFVVASFLIWIFYWLMTYVAFFAFSSITDLKLIDGLFVCVIGAFAFVVPVQGGIGAYHWIVSLGMMLYGLTREEGLAFATITHGSQALWTIILGTTSMILLTFIRRNKKTIPA